MTILGLIFRILNALLMIGLPCLAALLIYRRGRGGFRPIWIGVLAFVLSQVGHVPFNQFLLLPGLQNLGVDLGAQGGSSLVFLALGAGLSAGLFEEITRYLVFRFWLRERDSLLPVKYGIGHGGIEAFLAGFLALFALVQVLVLSGDGALGALPAETADLARSQLAAYWDIPLGMSLLGFWERVSAMLFHVGASLMVYKSVREKKFAWFLIALLGHAAMDAFAVIGVKTINLMLLEGILFAFALLFAAWSWVIRVRDPRLPEAAAPAPLEIRQSGTEATSRQLEESRYE
jgi:uncharacterized membrane protein YhfC